ncbi:MAG: DNA-processing protein DprA [Campylobacterota bacterium]|nr:DNA-processing protein DprA [Campylobacterota bacterium]
MINKIDFHIKELERMCKYPKELFYIGDTNLLKNKKISIVGSRRPSSYTKQFTHNIAKELSCVNLTIVSGAAMGVDAIAHKAAGSSNTIAVAGTGLDIRYPAVNRSLIKDIEENGLMLSQFKAGVPSQRYNFPLRNELVVALGDVLVVTQADIKSGTMRSVESALKMNKEIYVLPQRLGESEGTNMLLSQGKAKIINDIGSFVEKFVDKKIDKKENKIDEYFKTNPLYDEALKLYPNELFEYELSDKIFIENGKVFYK